MEDIGHKGIGGRKKCVTCGKYLISFQGCYLHPESPCSGIMDYLFVEAQVEDVFMHEKFEELYGKPKIDDYERVELIEQENERLSSLLSVPLIRFLLRLFKKV